MHAQIQNDGGPGRGGIAEMILYYRAAGSDQIVSAACQSPFAVLETKDIAEIDCYVKGDPLIYSDRIVGTDIKIFSLSTPASAPRRNFP